LTAGTCTAEAGTEGKDRGWVLAVEGAVEKAVRAEEFDERTGASGRGGGGGGVAAEPWGRGGVGRDGAFLEISPASPQTLLS
jgi:hypothetical protein